MSEKIHINGHLSDSMDIKNGYKQSDALSCSLFILGIDPLIRSLNRDQEIRKVDIITKTT
jgi:hypothetical protein